MSVSLPIPEPRAEDDEDVHWALSTASALWARGEPQEALKWLRRAAETASDANRDARSLELFKAAADFANGMQGVKPSAPPPAQAVSSVPPAPPKGSSPPGAPPAGWPTPGVVQMTVGNQVVPPQPRPQSAPPPAPHRSQPPPMPAQNGGPPPLHRNAQTPAPPPAQARGGGPVHPPPQRIGSSPPPAGTPAPPAVQSGPPGRAPARGEPQTWQPRTGQVAPAGPFHAAPGHPTMPMSEVMAPTMPHPAMPHPTTIQLAGGQLAAGAENAWPPPHDPSTARIPITDVDAAIKKMEAQRAAASNMKTLASNTSFEDLAEESVRRSARSTKPTTQSGRVASERATNPGVGPEREGRGADGSTVLSPGMSPASAVAQPDAERPDQAAATREAPREPALREGRAKRRATHSGKRGSRPDPSEQVTRIATTSPLADPKIAAAAGAAGRAIAAPPPVPGVPDGHVAIHDSEASPPPIEAPVEEARTMRFDDEGTLEQHATLVGVLAYDLDEQTNVLTAGEANLVLKPEPRSEAPQTTPASDADDGAPTNETPADADAQLVEPRRERPVTERPPGELGVRSLSAYRVALYRKPSGELEVQLLAPGEPTPAGRVGAILVPVDAVSSSALYELLAARPR